MCASVAALSVSSHAHRPSDQPTALAIHNRREASLTLPGFEPLGASGFLAGLRYDAEDLVDLLVGQVALVLGGGDDHVRRQFHFAQEVRVLQGHVELVMRHDHLGKRNRKTLLN